MGQPPQVGSINLSVSVDLLANESGITCTCTFFLSHYAIAVLKY